MTAADVIARMRSGGYVTGYSNSNGARVCANRRHPPALTLTPTARTRAGQTRQRLLRAHEFSRHTE
jgi:hypothetical protein